MKNNKKCYVTSYRIIQNELESINMDWSFARLWRASLEVTGQL